MAQKASGSLTITNITDGANANIWTTSTAPTTPNYTFTISNLTGADDNPRVGDIILQGVYRYTITSIGSTTVLAGSRQSLQGATGAAGGKWYSGTGITGTNTTAQVFSGSGVSSAVVGDMYLNTSTDNVYQCTTAGNASTAKWKYVGNIKGSTGSQGRSVTSVVTEYYRKLSGGSAPTSSTTGSTTIPDYVDGCTYYTRTITNFDSGNPDKSEWVANSGLTNEIKNAYDAWIAAGAAELKVAKIIQNSEGMIVTSGINGGDVTPGTTSTYGYNTLMAPNYLGLRYNAINLAKLTTTESTPALEFYIPSVNSGGTPVQGNKGLSISATALTFYNPSSNAAQLIIGSNGTLQSGNYTRGSDSKFSSNGTKIDLINGDIITKYFRVSQGLESGLNAGVYVHGTIEALDGTIGTDSTNYWEIGNSIDYNLNSTAKMVGHGSSYIQLGDSSTWRLSTNRIHTAWYTSGDSLLHFPAISSKYWDFGVHTPDSATDKFLYIRSSKSNTSTSSILQNLLYDIDDSYATPQWDYKFYIDGSGNLYAANLYFFDDNGNPVQVGGADGAYLPKTGGTIIGNLEVNGTLTKGNKNVAYLTATPTTNQVLIADGTTGGIKTSGYTIAKSVPSNALFTDENVKSTEANTTKLWLVGSDTSGTRTGTLKYDSGVYITTTAGTVHATTFEGNLSGTASRATADADGNAIKTTYLKLSGGNVTGAVTFGSSVSVDELTAGDLVVNGAASFTNNLQANTINGVAVGSSPKFTDNNTTYTFANGTNGFTVTPSGGTAQTVTVTPSITNNVTGSGTSGYLAKFTGANTIGNGPQISSGGTGFLRQDGTWATPAGTGVTSVAASGSGGITISGSPITTSGTIAIGLNLSTAINGLGEGSSPATRNDYIVAQYAGGGTETTTYHRRKLSNIFAALNASDITTALGYTPPTTDTNTHRPIKLDNTEILGNNTTALNLVTGGGIALSNSSGSVTIAHKDTSSQATSSNTGRTYIQSVTLDTYGHVTGLSTATETVTDTHYTTHLYVGESNGSANAATTNGNTYLMILDNTTVRDRRKISGSGAASVTSDSNGNITINSPVAITGVSFANGTITFTKSDSTTIPITTDNFVITQASGATALVKLKSGSTTEYEGYSAGGATTAPVYFDSNGHPVAVTSIPWGLIDGEPSTYTPSSHTHGNITNDGKITSTATIASGDKLVIVDTDSTAGSKITGSSITFGTSTTTFLSNKGTWETPIGTTYTFDGTYNASTNKVATVSTVTNAINALDGGTIGTPSASKTVTAISQTNGNISVTFGDISITKSQISDFPTSMTPAAHNHSQIVTVGDQRSTATTPNSYSNALIFQGLKSKAIVGSPSDDTYSYLVGLRGWSDSSGGNSHELAFNNTGIFWRQGATTSWGNWYRIYTTGNKPTASDVGLGNVTNYDSSVAIKSITRSGTTFTYTTVAGNTGTFTQQDNNTWDALSTSQAGYVAKAPNDTSKFLRGDATWAAVTKANVGLGNVDNTADANKRVKGANITTTANAVAYYTDTAGTFGSKASANGVLYATAANGTLNWGTLPIAQGGTGATTAANARTNLELGSAATYTAATSVGNNSNLPTGAAVQTYVTNAISGASNTYVTIATEQTITASQKTFNGAIRWGTSSKYGAVNYDSTLDALVFSFA